MQTQVPAPRTSNTAAAGAIPALTVSGPGERLAGRERLALCPAVGRAGAADARNGVRGRVRPGRTLLALDESGRAGTRGANQSRTHSSTSTSEALRVRRVAAARGLTARLRLGRRGTNQQNCGKHGDKNGLGPAIYRRFMTIIHLKAPWIIRTARSGPDSPASASVSPKKHLLPSYVKPRHLG